MGRRIIALFNLKPGVDRGAYEAWARDVDLPTVNGLGSIDCFETFRAAGLFGSDAAPPYQYIEIIDIADMDGFMADLGGETMQKVAAAFGEMTTDVAFIHVDRLA